MRGQYDLWDYVVSDSYGGIMPWTSAETKAECLEKYCKNGKTEADMRAEGSCVVRLAPIFVSGQGDLNHRWNRKEHWNYLMKGPVE